MIANYIFLILDTLITIYFIYKSWVVKKYGKLMTEDDIVSELKILYRLLALMWGLYVLKYIDIIFGESIGRLFL